MINSFNQEIMPAQTLSPAQEQARHSAGTDILDREPPGERLHYARVDGKVSSLTPFSSQWYSLGGHLNFV
jgi:hypothetical protein